MLLLGLPLQIRGIERLSLSLGSLSGAGWQVEALRLGLDWRRTGDAGFSLSARRIVHPALPAPLVSPRFDCMEGALSRQEVRCDRGVLHLESPLLDQTGFPVRFRWSRATGRITLKLPRLPLAGGTLELALVWQPAAWRLNLEGRQLSLFRLQKALQALGFPLPGAMQGSASLHLSADGREDGVEQGRWRLTIRDGGFSDQASGLFAEALNLEWGGDLARRKGLYSGQQRLLLKSGALLSPWFYLEPAGQQISLDTRYRFDPASGRLALEALRFRHPDHLAFSASGVFDTRPALAPVELQVASQPADPGTLLESYIAPVLGTALPETLTLGGEVSARLQIGSHVGADLALDKVELALKEPALQLDGIGGRLHWVSGGEAPPSTLAWSGGRLFGRLSVGAARFLLQLQERSGELLQPSAVPILDGALQIEKLRVAQQAQGVVASFQGYLEPISMPLLSKALEWPELAGQISGMIPEVSYRDGTLSVHGIILIRLFGGSILVKHLRLESLGGPLPVLTADLQLKGLDLETLTRTFSFGKITGKLAGRVEGLRLEGWRPVAFDARLGTPADDHSRHRISQKAVDNISNLGGSGVSGALSRGVLGMFETFGYDRLGIRCRLRNGVCEMDGVAPADQGYYLVQGGGIPRIDIVGFNRRIDWEQLLAKLKQITSGGTPVVR